MSTSTTNKKLKVFCHGERILTLKRIYAGSNRRYHQIDYKHVISSLMKSRECLEGGNLDEASFYMVRSLNVACKSEREGEVGRFVLDGILVSQLSTIFDFKDRFLKMKEELITQRRASTCELSENLRRSEIIVRATPPSTVTEILTS